MISLKEAAEKGIKRVRKPVWADQLDHLEISIVDGVLGVWGRLYAPFNKECNGRDPVEFLLVQTDCDAAEYEPYDGPLPDSDEYKIKQKRFEGCLQRKEVE